MELLSFEQALDRSPGPNKRHVLLGNGFSRAWRDDVFSYGALLDQANFNDCPTARKAFEALETTDFEYVMRALRNTVTLLRIYDGDAELCERLTRDANALREILVQTIAASHPARPSEISHEEYAHARRFLAHFQRIYTLNYDLLLYWTLMQQKIEPVVSSDDGFRTPDYGESAYVTWDVENTDTQNVFYMHGALHIFDVGHEIQKFTWINTGIALIDQVRSALEEGRYPLFVAEGTSESKTTRVRHSDYLSRGYRSFSKIGGDLFVFGHSMAPNDEHVISLIEKNKCSRLFVSLYGNPNSEGNLWIRERATQLAQHRPPSRPLEVFFFDAASASVWR